MSQDFPMMLRYKVICFLGLSFVWLAYFKQLYHKIFFVISIKFTPALARQTGQEEKEARSHLFQRLSVLLVKGNCSLFMNRKPDNIVAEIDGVE